MKTILEAINVSKIYNLDHRKIRVLDNVSLKVEKGEFLVISGTSGSGKTTLLSILSGLDQPTSGRIFIDQKDITKRSEERR